ncbi:MAG: sigma-70 family RNA polymerase sigma factor [Deltaproteobacteria bacterium]|nr:sigma-70 family RNA polymerase sigma factor [Deltaproteobacteria bacterium]
MLRSDKGVVAVQKEYEQDLAELYDRYGAAVYRLALRITQDPSAAEEICLDAFLQLWRQVIRSDQPRGRVQAWLFTIARSRAIDRVRAGSAVKRTQSDDINVDSPSNQPDEMADLAQRQRLVRDAMAELSSAQRAALELAYYEGLSHSQIATRLGEPLGTVKTRIRQAMLTLRQKLKPVLTTT